MSGNPTRLSAADEARLAEIAGQILAAIYVAPDDPGLRMLLADALDGVDQVRGRSTQVAATRPWPINEPPAVSRTRANPN
ncbi:hypothetical protein [Streptomonospora sediminis]